MVKQTLLQAAFRAICSTLFLLGITITVQASEKVVVYTEQWPPYNYYDNDNNLVGLATANVHDIFQRTDIDYNIQLLAWVRAYSIAKTTPNSLIYSIFRSEQREPYFHWFCPLTKPMKIGLFKLTERKDIAVTDLESAKQYKVGIVRGDYANLFLHEQGFLIDQNLMVATDDDANVNLLLRGRIDLTVQNGDSLYYRLNRLKLKNDTVTQVLETIDGKSQHNCLALNINSSPALVHKIQTAFDAHLKSRLHTPDTQPLPH